MRLVDVEQRAWKVVLHVYELLQASDVAVHAEHALGHDDGAVESGVVALQQGAELVVVLMPEAQTLGRREPEAVDEACVHQFVGQDERPAVRKGRQDARVHVIAAAEH